MDPQSALQWADANPNDPRASQVRAKAWAMSNPTDPRSAAITQKIQSIQPTDLQPAAKQAQAAGGTQSIVSSVMDGAKKVYNYLDQKMGQNDSQSSSLINKATQEHQLPNVNVLNEFGVGAPGSGLPALLGKGVKASVGPIASFVAPGAAKALTGGAKVIDSLAGLLGGASKAVPAASEAEAGVAAAAPGAADTIAKAVSKKPWDFSQLPIQKR